ncbi:acyl-CoA thioesterase [Glaciecola sp. 2405UD65-10]|uniref:acyl-CoA thioesterase n=1 Tax=Glaciecola sp. 2405UD65-10 TaxID=3397244 RepID=UPI003B5BC8F3
MHTTETEPFELLIRVRYSECDAQSVVFNARYADYADLASTEFMREVMGGYQHILDMGFDNQVVSMHIDWQSSAKFDDILSLKTRVIKAGNSSFCMQVDMFEFTTGRAIATAQIVYVMVDAKLFKKLPIPLSLKESLLAGAPSVQVNLAGKLI